MTAAHYKGGHYPGTDLGLHYTALPPIVASCPYSDQLLVTRKFWSPGANRPSQASLDSSGIVAIVRAVTNSTDLAVSGANRCSPIATDTMTKANSPPGPSSMPVRRLLAQFRPKA